MNKTLCIFIAAFLVVSCTPHNVKPNHVDGPIDCASACKNMQDARCEEGDPTPRKKKPCVEWCGTYHDPDAGMRPWAPCVAAAGPDPEKIEACNMKCTVKP